MSFTVDPAIVRDITTVIRKAVAEDWIQEFEIGANTSFNDDLDLESVEFVTIAAGLQQHFGEHIDLIGNYLQAVWNEVGEVEPGRVGGHAQEAGGDQVVV